MNEGLLDANTTRASRIAVHERPLMPGWVYPCSAEDILQCLCRIPARDVEGLTAVVLAPSTRKDHSANARYFSGERPIIEVYSYPATFTYTLPSHTKWPDIETGLVRELEYGMDVRRVGARWFCEWALPELRRFILQHVLLHEVGHHVYHRDRKRQGLGYRTGRVSEAFAESYAMPNASLLRELFT